MTSEAKAQYAQNFFIFNRWMLKYAGLWAPENSNIFIHYFYKFYQILVFSFVNVFFTFTEFLSVMETYENADFLIKNINFALTHLMGAFKCIFWFYRGKDLINLIETLESEEFYYEICEDFDPGLLSRKAKRTGQKYTFSFFMLAHMTLSSSYIPPLASALFNPIYIDDSQGNKKFFQRLPYFCWMPFSYDTPGRYLIALAYQAGPMFSYAYSIVGMDTLFMNIMNYVGTHIHILQGAFRTIKKRCVKRLKYQELLTDGINNSNPLDEEMKKEMKKSVKHLQTIFRVCNKLEDIHKYLTLGQVVATLFILCTSLFLVSTTPVTSKQFAAESVYMIAMGFQLILYCWFGNEVTLRATQLPDAIWEGDWLGSSYQFRSSMLITMIRMKRPLNLTVGKFAPLTLNTFVGIIKASYSFFAVLKKVRS